MKLISNIIKKIKHIIYKNYISIDQCEFNMEEAFNEGVSVFRNDLLNKINSMKRISKTELKEYIESFSIPFIHICLKADKDKYEKFMNLKKLYNDNNLDEDKDLIVDLSDTETNKIKAINEFIDKYIK